MVTVLSKVSYCNKSEQDIIFNYQLEMLEISTASAGPTNGSTMICSSSGRPNNDMSLMSK